MVSPTPPSAVKGFLARLSQAGEGVYSARRKIATGAAGVLAVTMGYHVIFGQNGLTAYRAKRTNERELRMQMQELQRENSELRGHVDRLSNDPNAIEHEAREELHYTRPGEVIYTMPIGK
jgi:cell division protein FtsB